MVSVQVFNAKLLLETVMHDGVDSEAHSDSWGMLWVTNVRLRCLFNSKKEMNSKCLSLIYPHKTFHVFSDGQYSKDYYE